MPLLRQLPKVAEIVIRCALVWIWLFALGLAPCAPAFAQEKRGENYIDLRREVEEKIKARQWAAAAALWERIAALNPHEGENWAQLAYARHLANDYRGAVAAYENAISLGAGNPASSTFDIARCQAQLGEKERALDSLERALGLGLRELWRLRTEAELAPLRSEPRFKRLAFDEETDKMTRDEGWRFDLRFLAHELKRLHHTLRARPSHPEIDAHVSRLDGQIPRLSDHEIEVGLMKLVLMAGDGQTSIIPRYARREGKQAAPVHFYLFPEGLYITAAAAEYAELAGAEVLGVGAHRAGEALAALAAVIGSDNEMGLKSKGPELLRYPQILYGLGLLPKPDLLPLTIKDRAGAERRVELPLRGEQEPGKWMTARDASAPAPLYLEKREANYSFEYLTEEKTVYFRYHAARHEPTDPFDKFCERLFQFIDRQAVERLVIDLRFNEGGSSHFHQPLLEGLVRCQKINRRGHLFVIVGRGTLSAATSGATEIERYTRAIFVGEPTGSSPGSIGEPVRIALPWSRLVASIADRYCQNSAPADRRLWIAPELYTPLTFAAYRANRDPALEAILSSPQQP